MNKQRLYLVSLGITLMIPYSLILLIPGYCR